MSDIKLLPCPFCGGEVFVEYTPQTKNESIKCPNCNLTMARKHFFSDGTHEIDLYKVWNTRKPMERIIERLKENSNFLLHEMEDSKMYAGNESAIEIVKEEGGIE